MRHGRAERGGEGDDRERRLTAEGERDVRRLGARLRERGWSPEIALASPAVRARATAELILESAGGAAAALAIEPAIYEASCGELLEILEAIDGAPRRVLVVGHNPAIERAAAYLGGAPTGFAPGTLARLIMPDDWRALSSGCASLAEVVPIEALR